MRAHIGSRVYTLDQKDVLGSGGEGTVFRKTVEGEELAVKIYHTPTPLYAQKLQAFTSRDWGLPVDRIAIPLILVTDMNGQIIGYGMSYFGTGKELIAKLSNRKHRNQYRITTKDVALIYLDGAKVLQKIQGAGFIYGDLKDLNTMYGGVQMFWMDFDACQFGNFPCVVGSERFLVPELYDTDLSLRPMYKPEYDWYAFLAMMCESLLLTHPFGGVHRTYKRLVTRAQNHIMVDDPSVIYPSNAYPIDVLDDDLAEIMHKWFAKGYRGAFDIAVLERYTHSLIPCPTCGSFYPQSRKVCPFCNAITIAIIQKPTVSGKGVTVTEIIRTNGKIVFSKVVGDVIYLIANEAGKAVLYEYGKGRNRRTELFNEIIGARYDISGTTLIVNLPRSNDLLLLDVSGAAPKPITKLESTAFAGTRHAMFRASRDHIFRIINDTLMYGWIENGALQELPLRTVVGNQTWFTVRDQTEDGKPTVFGAFQLYSQFIYWLVRGDSFYDITISNLEKGESLIDLSVRFSSQGLVLRRLTDFQGVEYIRTEIVDNDGTVSYSSGRIRREDHQAPMMHGQTYSSGVYIVATDEGLVRESITTGEFKLFDATKGYVKTDDTLYRFQNGILVVNEQSAQLLVLG